MYGNRLIFRIRYWIAKLIYDFIFFVLVRDGSWEEGLLASLAPKPGDRILDFGPGSASTAISLAKRCPEATFVGMDPNPRSTKKARLAVSRRELRNVSFVEDPFQETLPFDASSFDKAICILGLHDRSPEEKARVVKAIARVVRRGGTFHLADFDKPENPSEGKILEYARRISGSAAAEPHINGRWVETLTDCGFAGVRRQLSRSIGIGRIAIVKARKR